MRTWSVLLTVATLAVACDRAPDMEASVRSALDQANMQAVMVEVDDDAGIVHLQGTVASIADRTRAEEVATATVGTSGRVLNELTVRGLNEDTADDLDGDIDDALDTAVARDPVLKERDIDFSVANGMVTITGEVASADEKTHVEQLAKAAPGVKDVANGLAIKTVR